MGTHKWGQLHLTNNKTGGPGGPLAERVHAEHGSDMTLASLAVTLRIRRCVRNADARLLYFLPRSTGRNPLRPPSSRLLLRRSDQTTASRNGRNTVENSFPPTLAAEFIPAHIAPRTLHKSFRTRRGAGSSWEPASNTIGDTIYERRSRTLRSMSARAQTAPPIPSSLHPVNASNGPWLRREHFPVKWTPVNRRKCDKQRIRAHCSVSNRVESALATGCHFR